MDIFTTQLTRVAPNKIKPDKLRVKGLAKDAKLKSLDAEHEHLDGHEGYIVTQQHAEKQFHSNNEEAEKLQHTNQNATAAETESANDIALSDAIDKSHVSNIEYEEGDAKSGKDKTDKVKKIKHLDIFV